MILLLSLLGCDPPCEPVSSDADGDGAVRWLDCGEAASVPVEPCVATTWYADADRDGAGDPAAPLDRCEAPAGYVADASDCDDADPGVLPGASEACDDVDQDCDGEVDEGAPADRTWYADADGDGYGVDAIVQCAAPAGSAAASGDCDDADAAVNPGAAEIPYDDIDQDCDAATDDDDFDGDGYPYGHRKECDDTDATVYQGASEVCGDGVDNDCDGVADVGCVSLADAETRIDGTGEVDQVGYGVAGAGDVDGDGRDDVWIGSRHVSAGALLLVRGGTSGALGPDAVDAVVVGGYAGWFGSAFAPAGDLDGDGHPDVIVGAWDNEDGGASAGAAWLLYGPFAGTVEAADVGTELVGAEGDKAGLDVTAGTDLDGDGGLDVAVLADGPTVYVVGGATAGGALPDASARITGLPDYGGAVDAVGDLDGDGFAELAVVTLSPHEKLTHDGTLHLFRGPFAGTIDAAAADATLTRLDLMNPGISVEGRGDADGDGRADLLVGVASAPVRVELYLDALGVGVSVPDALVEDNVTNWGANAAWAGDVDGDGRDDALLATGETMDDGRGVAWLFTAPLAGTLDRSAAAASFAGDTFTAVPELWAASAGDIDADGLADLVFGSPYAEPGGVYAGGSAFVVRGPF